MTGSDSGAAGFGHRADFLFGLALLTLGLGVAVESWRMPRLAELGVHPMTAPGLVPGLIGAVIALLGGILFLRAARAGGWRLARGGVGGFAEPAWRFALTLALCVGYAAGLVGRLPFWAATALFVGLFVALFEWRRGRSATGHMRGLAVAGLQAALVAAAVTWVFEAIFLVRLP